MRLNNQLNTITPNTTPEIKPTCPVVSFPVCFSRPGILRSLQRNDARHRCRAGALNGGPHTNVQPRHHPRRVRHWDDPFAILAPCILDPMSGR
jgi:hypothetical protein